MIESTTNRRTKLNSYIIMLDFLERVNYIVHKFWGKVIVPAYDCVIGMEHPLSR